MDERKNVKVVDEHGIDRVANIICSVDVDGTDYVLYFIKRDDENDNLFISKLIKNNDATFNMVNIEDSMEKGKLVEIVKELIKYSVDTELDKTTGSVTLSNGKTVTISNVLFNREQNINVSKTYVTTVKRAVTKVSDKFYTVESVQNVTSVASPVVEPVIVPETPVVTPVVPEVSMPVLEPSMPEVPAENVVQPVESSNANELVLPDAINVDSSSSPAVDAVSPVEPVVMPSPTVNEVPTVAPILPTEPVTVNPSISVPSSDNVMTGAAIPNTAEIPSVPVTSDQPTVAPILPTEPVIPSVSTNSEVPATSNVVETPVAVAPILPDAPSVVSTPEVSVPSTTDTLVFDGSKETNLNVALGEMSQDNSVIVNDVEPIREFGQDDIPAAPVVNVETPVTVANATDNSQSGENPVGNAGFANNKFFMVVAISFFLAACVFLGYEVVRYFQIVK